jgi:hypothetical protein
MKVFAVGRRDVMRHLSLVAALGPSVFLCVFIATGAYVRLHLGYWPMSSDSINTPLMKVLNTAVFCAVSWSIYAFPVWLVTSIWLLLQRRFRLAANRAALYAGVIALTIVVMRFDPTPFTEFFFD